jgi:hypothetical protein
MTTFNEGLKNIGEEAYKAYLFDALGTELTEEIKNSSCELIIDLARPDHEFINCPPEMEEKINKRWQELKSQRK